MLQAPVSTVQVIPLVVMIDHAVPADHYGGSKHADFVPIVVEVEAHGIEGPGRIRVVGWSDHAFVTEGENLASGN